MIVVFLSIGVTAFGLGLSVTAFGLGLSVTAFGLGPSIAGRAPPRPWLSPEWSGGASMAQAIASGAIAV